TSLSLITFISCNFENEYEGTKSLNYITFESESYDFDVDLGGSSTRDIYIYSTQTSSSERTFNISVVLDDSSLDSESYSVPTYVTIPANTNVGMLTISISDVNISEEGETLVIEFTASSEVFNGERITLNVKQKCPFNEVVFDVTFDSWAEETGWTLADANGNILDSAPYGTYADYESGEQFSKAFCLENGEYTFTIYDQYGDGTGDYKLVYNGTILAQGGGFGGSDATTFTVSL
ncbi:MAG: hypothetical protein COB73_08820, partial [Flavobacteriaceae bacterium]